MLPFQSRKDRVRPSSPTAPGLYAAGVHQCYQRQDFAQRGSSPAPCPREYHKSWPGANGPLLPWGASGSWYCRLLHSQHPHTIPGANYECRQACLTTSPISALLSRYTPGVFVVTAHLRERLFSFPMWYFPEHARNRAEAAAVQLAVACSQRAGRRVSARQCLPECWHVHAMPSHLRQDDQYCLTEAE